MMGKMGLKVGGSTPPRSWTIIIVPFQACRSAVDRQTDNHPNRNATSTLPSYRPYLVPILVVKLLKLSFCTMP